MAGVGEKIGRLRLGQRSVVVDPPPSFDYSLLAFRTILQDFRVFYFLAFALNGVAFYVLNSILSLHKK